MAMTSKHIDLGLLELLGNKVPLLLLPALATLSKLAPEHLTKQDGLTLPLLGLEGSEKDKWASRETQGNDEGGIQCHHGPVFWGIRSSFYLVYTQNKCLELTRQNLMKEAYTLLVFDFHKVSIL